jgi:hypothetical protein
MKLTINTLSLIIISFIFLALAPEVLANLNLEKGEDAITKHLKTFVKHYALWMILITPFASALFDLCNIRPVSIVRIVIALFVVISLIFIVLVA